MAKKKSKRAAKRPSKSAAKTAAKKRKPPHVDGGPLPLGGPAWLGALSGTERKATLLSLLVATLSGTLWFTACANFDIWPFAWFAMVPGLIVIERAPTRRRAYLYGWFVGIVANVGGFYWISSLLVRFGHLPLPVALLGLVLLCSYQATVFLLFALAIRRIRIVSAQRLGAPLPMALVAPLVMVCFEITVPFIFPWYLAITQAWVIPVIQVAELAGPVGVTALLMAVNGALYDVITERTVRRRLLPAGGALVFVAAALVFGYVRIAQVDARRAAAPKIKVGVVQGNIPFDEKGINRPALAAQQLRDLQDKSAELQKQGADLLMWTESSYPYAISRNATGDARIRYRRFRRDASGRLIKGKPVFTAPLLLGALTRPVDPDDPRRWDRNAYPYNSALMLEGDEFVGRFDKIFLLMFGEYIPLVETFPSIRKVMPRNASHLARGDKIVTFPFEHEGTTYRLGPLICYEDILPDFGRKLGKQHPHLLTNITNDAWFGESSEPWEHMALSVFRSVELRADMVRAVNTGVSAFIDANGRVYHKTYAVDPKKTPKGVDGIIDEVALMESGHTFYARFGNVFGWLCVLLTLLMWLVWPRVRRRTASSTPT